MMKPNSKQFKVTYKDAEAPVLVPIEYQMMREIGCDRSSLHKMAIREMHNRRQQSTLHFIWGKNEESSGATNHLWDGKITGQTDEGEKCKWCG